MNKTEQFNQLPQRIDTIRNMSENRVEEIVRAAVAQALERQLASLRENVVQDVLREVGPVLASKDGASTSAGSSATLQKAISAIQAGTTQKEILRALLENTVLYSGRAALFVVKNGAATGWQGIAFGNNDAIKDFGLDITSGMAACDAIADIRDQFSRGDRSALHVKVRRTGGRRSRGAATPSKRQNFGASLRR